MSLMQHEAGGSVLEFPLLSQGLDTLLWPSLRGDQVSAWHGHVSFAHWIVSAMQPATVVELGTHNGVSFAAFCNAVARTGSPTRCYAVDTWMGDAHAGFYDETVFENMANFNRTHFASFATLLRCRFDEALSRFDAGSIDLLHIDGMHTYEAVSEDFRTWLPKLSSRAVVLFHDIAIHEHGFGVWRLWAELSGQYPHFSFQHSAGLGVLAVGPQASPVLLKLCALEGTADADLIRGRLSWASGLAYHSGKAELERQAAMTIDRLIGPGTNIALNCVAFQSSEFNGEPMTPGAAVNGIRTGGYAFHTAAEANPWWMVDLGRSSRFDLVAIFNRMDPDCACRARNLVLLVSTDGENWVELYRANGKNFGGIDGNPLIVRCKDTQARFVRVRLDGTEFLHLDQVEIYRQAA